LTNPTPHVFVYGTLQPGGRYYPLALSVGLVAAEPAFVEGFCLFHLEPENYPAMTVGEGRVYGSLLSFRDISLALKTLDALEGLHLTPPEYCRALVSALPQGCPAWTYLYADVERLSRGGASKVEGGNWTPR